ncbi:hypothetical protein AAMO2058_000533100 [Amorphochlora amoebiformis]
MPKAVPPGASISTTHRNGGDAQKKRKVAWKTKLRISNSDQQRFPIFLIFLYFFANNGGDAASGGVRMRMLMCDTTACSNVGNQTKSESVSMYMHRMT